MLHTKCLGNRLIGSVEEIFEGFLPYMGIGGGHLGHVTPMPRINVCSPCPSRVHTNLGFDWSSGFGDV